MNPVISAPAGWRSATARPRRILLLLGVFTGLPSAALRSASDLEVVFIRVSQVGYPAAGIKSAVAFSTAPLEAAFQLVDAATGHTVFAGRVKSPQSVAWGTFPYHAELDFSAVRKSGRFLLRLAGGRPESPVFTIGPDAYSALPDQLLEFMRQQRCGYNPFLDAVCHPFDGRTAFAPSPDGTYLEARGGWHDAGDQLKYLLTAGNATAQMLLAYRLAPRIFGDRFNDLGQPVPNGVPDVLDEARWGLDWMLRLHPAPDQLYHMVADDRDHSGWRLPQNDTSDYGWGPGSYRVVYFATGRPQGLGKFQSESTGMANLAGRYAAAMALAYQVWRDDPRWRVFAERCLQAGKEVYSLGKAHEGVQQGNSYGAPYRYNEETWADDMEWGAAELYRATRERSYLDDAGRYARLIGAASWMGLDTAAHYQFYPFMNLGHFALHDLAGKELRGVLAGYYRQGLESCRAKGENNPYGIGVPFIWCSNNLDVALATQGLLYQRMTGDASYRSFVAAHVDWLFGRNPWGTSMFTGIPDGGIFPRDPHLVTTNLTGRTIRGGLVDGPVAESIFNSLKGVALSRPDPFAPFQSEGAVYHDDMKDYSSNEPTMDGTASAVLLLALLSEFR